MPFDAVVFDLDGTLADTAPDLQAHVNSVLEELGRPGLDLDEVRLLVGDGARTLLRRGLEATGGVPAGADLDLLYARFLERYTARPADNSTVHTDVVEVLEGLQARGLRLGVCTNKAQAPTDRLLAALGLDRFFEAIVGRRRRAGEEARRRASARGARAPRRQRRQDRSWSATANTTCVPPGAWECLACWSASATRRCRRAVSAPIG